MTCLEAQSKIMAFIENKLPDDELKEFIKHVKNCDNCSEELEIYYTLIVGMKELDNEENLSTNFKKELDDKLDEEMTWPVAYMKMNRLSRRQASLSPLFYMYQFPQSLPPPQYKMAHIQNTWQYTKAMPT